MMSRMAVAIQRRQRPAMVPKSMPAPIGGWVSAQNVAAMAPGTCLKCVNAFPTTTGVRVRGGNIKHATLNTDPTVKPVESLMAYVGASVRHMFGAADGDIYPITTVVDPNVIPTPDVTGQTSNYYAWQNFATTGGYYMYAVNGTDDALLYDGTAWTPIDGASTPAITGATTSSFSHVNVFRNRLYFVEKNSLTVWYLPVDSIGGAASALSLSGIFSDGGSVFFTATWSSESGSSALSDYLVVVSTQGEFAIFQGSYPGGTDWSLAGVYELGSPLGINGWFKAGGDIVVLTDRGAIPVSAARFKDPSALSMDAISKDIHPDWAREVSQRRAVPWEAVKWDAKSALFINVPVVSSATPPRPFVANLQTGKWCEYTAWDTRCMVVHDGQMYFGCNDGTVRTAEVSGYDLDQPYTYQIAMAWDHLGPPGNIKTIRQAKAEFLTTGPFSFVLSASTDYTQQFPNPPSVMADPNPASLWDTGLWDVALWDSGEVAFRQTTRWVSIGRTGEIFSMEIQIPIGSANTPNTELSLLLWTAETGGLVV